jgi:HEAT repeat protein
MRAILPTLLLAISWSHPPRADEPQRLYGKTTHEWIAAVRDRTGTKAERAQAVWAVGCFGPEARAAVPDLVDELRRGQLKDAALEALVRIGAGTDATVPYLIEQFRKQGCEHLTGMGSIGFNPRVKDNLVRIGGPAVPALLDVLNGPDRDMRVCAAEALGEIGSAARAAVPALVREIERPDAIERPDRGQHAGLLSRYAVKALGRIGPDAKAAVPALNRLLDREGGDDLDVVMALGRIGTPPVRKLLGTFLHEGDSWAAEQLAWLGPKAREAAPALRAALKDGRAQVRVSAAVALAHVEPSSAREAVPQLTEALNHPNDEAPVLYTVPRALARLGPSASTALPSLIAAMKKERDDTDTLKALVQIDPEGKVCVPALIAALKSDGIEEVHVAANCLGLLGPRAGEAVPSLAAGVTRDFDESFANGYDPQVSAANALRRIGPHARPAIPALIGALKYRRIIRLGFDGEEKERDSTAAAAAARVLGSFGADAKAAVPALIEAAKAREKDDANWSVRKAAILALGQIGPDARPAIPVLRNLMEEDGKPSQYQPEVIVALSQLAPDGKELAEKWLAKPWKGRQTGRAMVLGAIVLTSVDIDLITRDYLIIIDRMITDSDPRDGGIEVLEEWLEALGRFGYAGHLAIPRLKDYCKHPDPWVRMWATEALERITSPTPARR